MKIEEKSALLAIDIQQENIREMTDNRNNFAWIIISKANPDEINELETIYKEAFESNVFPDNMIETEEDEHDTDLSPEISMKRDDLISLSIYHMGKLVGGAILDCTNYEKNKLERLFISSEVQNKGLGYEAWKIIEHDYSKKCGWTLKTPTCLMNNIYFYINKCGFRIVKVEDIGADGIGMFVFEKP